MNSKNTKISDPYRLLLNLTDKINLKRRDKYIALSNLSMYYAWKNIRKSYKNSKIKISALTWNEEFELPDGSYPVSEKHRRKTDNPATIIYVNKIKTQLRL